MENTHYKNSAKIRVTCDASREGLGAVLEQNFNGDWRLIAYSSRFLNECEQRYSTNELELLAVVWSLEHFRNSFHGRDFEIGTDHRPQNKIRNAQWNSSVNQLYWIAIYHSIVRELGDRSYPVLKTKDVILTEFLCPGSPVGSGSNADPTNQLKKEKVSQTDGKTELNRGGRETNVAVRRKRD